MTEQTIEVNITEYAQLKSLVCQAKILLQGLKDTPDTTDIGSLRNLLNSYYDLFEKIKL